MEEPRAAEEECCSLRVECSFWGRGRCLGSPDQTESYDEPNVTLQCIFLSHPHFGSDFIGGILVQFPIQSHLRVWLELGKVPKERVIPSPYISAYTELSDWDYTLAYRMAYRAPFRGF